MEDVAALRSLQTSDWGSKMSIAAKSGNLRIFQWARENGCPWDEATCSFAAREGHLHILQWARENGCPWNEWTTSNAADAGHFHIMDWAIENGCPWDEHIGWAGEGELEEEL